MIVMHATVPIDPESREEALELISELVDHSQAEDGVVDYRAAADVDDPNLIRFFEQYEDEEAFAAHAGSEHFQEFQAALPEHLAGEPTLTRFDVDSVSDVEL
jgi:quinol monooxygenase YgiN